MEKNKKIIITFIIVFSILILAIITGIIVYKLNNKEQKEVENSPVTNFNSNFTSYEGANIPASKIKTLISEIITSNTIEEHQILVKIIGTELEEGTKDAATLSMAVQTMNSEYTYLVTLEYDEEGYINAVKIEQEITEEQRIILEFNKQFSPYVGNNVSATLVKSLISQVILNNNSETEHQINIKVKQTTLEEGTTDISDLTDVQQLISDENLYSVELKYGNDGYISEMVIEKLETENSAEIREFNQKFEKYQGQIMTGAELKEILIANIKTSNEENLNHKINLYSGSLQSVKEINDTANYKITISYDSNGYVYRIDATEQD